MAHRRFGASAEYANDIAILRIENSNGEGAKLSEHVHPICLPDHSDWELEMMRPHYGDCIVSGFGSINGRQYNLLCQRLSLVYTQYYTCYIFLEKDHFQKN